MSYQVHFHWQIPPGAKVSYTDNTGKVIHGIVCTTAEREEYIATWANPHKGYEIVVARWRSQHNSPHWMRLSKVWVEGNVCGNCGESEAPADDYLCAKCRKLDS